MNTAPSQTPSDLSPAARQLLGIVRSLARELRPGAPSLESLGLDHSLADDFGFDSLTRVELLVRIGREMGDTLPEEALAEAETPRDLLRLMTGDGEKIGPPEPVAPRPETAIEHPPETIATLTGMLDWHVDRHGGRTHITLLAEEGRTEDITYRRLQSEARDLAAGLLGNEMGGLQRGDRIAIMLPTGREFFAAFYGALYAGCVPVPLYPPTRPSQLEEHLRRVAGIIANSGAALLVTDPRAKALGALLRSQCPTLTAVMTAPELARPGEPVSPPRSDAHDPAFLQYTSGSTGNPKGVVLTHANLLANLRAMEQASGITSEDIFVSWLPLYHDMGLIGACMGSLCLGFRLVLMSPLAFLARPSRWLWTIHHHRATVSAAPNFAYELCASKLADRDLAGLDLSSWRLAFNGAEPVSPDTLRRFTARLAPYGFKQEAMTPVYGLAEASVGLAFPPIGRGPLIDLVDRSSLAAAGLARPASADDRQARRIVSCGLPLPGHAIRIVDADDHELPERTQGRIQFQGPSATSGYFRNPEATGRLLTGSWLNTGDLGYLAAGELFLTGREKDIIIRGGHNIHPQELEEAVSRVRGVRKGGVAVFAATDPRAGTERLVVLAETREQEDNGERDRIMTEINRLALDMTGFTADDIVLAPPRTVLKTSSGKIRRAACRDLYERGELLRSRRPPWLQAMRLAGSGAWMQAKDRLRQGAVLAWSAWAWTIFAAVAPIATLLIVLAPGLGLRRRIARAGARMVLALTGLKPRVEGLHHLTGLAPAIVAANHASYLDGLILTAVLPSGFTYVAKQELLHNAKSAIPLRRLGTAFVERDSPGGEENTRSLEARVLSGESLVFFAEGTFHSAPGLLPFRMGAFVVAARCGVPVIPIALTGTRALLRGEELHPHFSRMAVLIGKPILAQGENEWQAAVQLRDTARRWVLAHLEEPDAGL